MPYYLLQREGGALYSMNLLLSEDEARRYGQEGEMVPVTALVICTDAEALEDFRQFLSVEQQDQHSAFSELIKDIREDRVNVLEFSADQLRNQLSKHQRVRFVCIDPGPDQRVQQTDEFLVSLT